MKNFFYLFFVIIFSSYSCDKIETPIPPVFGNIDWSLYPGDSNEYLDLYNFSNPSTNWNINTNSKKYILLEDYTGHKCTNCPQAANIAKNLENDTSLGVIVASIHASPTELFQQTDSEFNIDFTTISGTEYTTTIITEGEFPGNPCGTINRKSGSPLLNSHWYFSDSWADAVNSEFNNHSNLLANIQLQFNYFPATNGLFIHTETEILDNLSGDYHLIIYLVRNEVISPQEFNGYVDHHYHHHSVVSDNVNGTWGTRIVEGSASSGDKFYNDFSYQLPNPLEDSTFEIGNVSLITYLCERNSFEVIQVNKTELE
jgi:hypothetical protein